MGLILDSGVLIAAKRKDRNTRQVLTNIALRVSGEDVALSVVTVIELMHGAVRADSPARKGMRRQFLHELLTTLPVHLVTVPVALRIGQLVGENTAKSVRLAVADLLIGVTALEPGYGVLTGMYATSSAFPALTVLKPRQSAEPES